MAMENKRIIQLNTERTTPAADDYVMVDSATSGTAKYLLPKITDAIDQEISDRTSADTTLQTAITNEATARTNADTTLQGNITAEATARAAADTAINGEITQLKEDLTTVDYYYYPKYGAFTGSAFRDSTKRVYIIVDGVKRFKKFLVHYPNTITFAGMWKKIGGTWTGMWGDVVNDVYSVTEDIECFMIIFKNKTDDNADVTNAELSEIYISIIDSHKKRVPVVYGGFSVSNNQMVEYDNTIRAKTIICNTEEYGTGIALDLPQTININSIFVYNGATWSSINLVQRKKFDFGSSCKQFRLSFVNKTDPNTQITAEELKNIIIRPIYPEYFNPVISANSSWYYGKKYVALGDSVTYGYIPRNYAGYPGQLDSFAKLAAEKLGMEFVNQGISGNTLAAVEGINNPMSVRYTNLPNDADLITVMGGTNDIRYDVPLGQMSDRTNTTWYGALHVLLGGLYKKYFIDQGVTVGKGKKIVVCTPIKLLRSSASTQGGTGTLYDFTQYCDAIKEVANYYSFPVLDFQNLSGINPHLNETIQGTEEGYTGFYNPYITDGTHPTQEGQEIMSNILVGFLKSIA